VKSRLQWQQSFGGIFARPKADNWH